MKAKGCWDSLRALLKDLPDGRTSPPQDRGQRERRRGELKGRDEEREGAEGRRAEDD